MRILHLLDHSLPTQSGYAYRSAAILREQSRRGWETRQWTGPKQGRSPDATEVVDGIRYERVGSQAGSLDRLPAGKQIAVVQSLRRRLKKFLRREKPDIIHAHSPCLNAIAAMNLGVPLVYEMRSSWEDAAVSNGTTREGSIRYRASRALETWVLRRANAVTTICEGLRREVANRGIPADRITVIPNAVDADGLISAAEESGEIRRKLGLAGGPAIGFVGSFFAWEGLDLLIEAMPRIRRLHPGVRLLLAGGGICEPELREAIRRRGLEQDVILAGQVPHARIGAYYGAIDLLVYPRLSLRLTEMVTPLKPLEAMASGKAVVASDVGGHRELITDGETGLLFAAGDTEALTAAVVRVLGDGALANRLGSSGLRYVREQRSWAAVVAGYEPVYRRLLSGERACGA